MSSSKKESNDQKQFREYCRAWLKDNNPPAPDFRMPPTGEEIMTQEEIDYSSNWEKSAYEAGLVGCDYPKEFGGGGRESCQIIANQEMALAKTPIFPNPVGLGWAAPTIFFHGSAVLKKQLLPKLFSGEEVWCQGFSEPGAGSDLANVQTFAERSGEKWTINGHKIWTSCAHYSSWMILLARTDKSDKYRGLSYFVVPIKAALGKGVTVKSLIKISGESGFNEVFFDDLEIPDAYRLDEVGKGWDVAMTTLAHERRAGEFEIPVSGGQIQRAENKKKQPPKSNKGQQKKKEYPLVTLAKNTHRNGKPTILDPVLRDKIMQALSVSMAIRQHRRVRNVSGIVDSPQRMAMQEKLIISEYVQDVAALAMEIEGPSSTLYVADDRAPEAGKWPLSYLSSFGGTIAGGSSEIQRNILGERVLGLAKTK